MVSCSENQPNKVHTLPDPLAGPAEEPLWLSDSDFTKKTLAKLAS